MQEDKRNEDYVEIKVDTKTMEGSLKLMIGIVVALLLAFFGFGVYIMLGSQKPQDTTTASQVQTTPTNQTNEASNEPSNQSTTEIPQNQDFSGQYVAESNGKSIEEKVKIAQDKIKEVINYHKQVANLSLLKRRKATDHHPYGVADAFQRDLQSYLDETKPEDYDPSITNRSLAILGLTSTASLSTTSLELDKHQLAQTAQVEQQLKKAKDDEESRYQSDKDDMMLVPVGGTVVMMDTGTTREDPLYADYTIVNGDKQNRYDYYISEKGYQPKTTYPIEVSTDKEALLMLQTLPLHDALDYLDTNHPKEIENKKETLNKIDKLTYLIAKLKEYDKNKLNGNTISN